jgi:hypothetical protein
LFEEEGVEGVEGVGGFVGVEGGFGHEADGFFAEGFIGGGAFEVAAGVGVIAAAEGGLAEAEGAFGHGGGGEDGGAKPGEGEDHVDSRADEAVGRLGGVIRPPREG